ncbi:ArsR/SmtB family transcription factor [Flexivirga meconopsidis]|uniref:ArsR/SmtB family transcription factor n=1 Tax=Flexivirga meconopsidis TaxID=2977121 RepID=UPI00223EB1BD
MPDYLTPFTHASTMTALAPLLNDTAADLVQEQLTSLQLAPGARTAAWWRQRRDRITRAAIAHWSDSLAPYWTQIRACVATDLEHRSQTLAAAGVEGLLTTLGSGISWTYPTLSIPWFTDVDLPLCGRGLVLQPIYFGWRHALVQDDPGESTVLAIPVHEHVPLKSTPRAQPDELHAVLGRARSRILGLLASTPASTSDVARHTSMSPGNASRHLKALRYSGLVSSRRTGQQVTHQLTAAGAVLYRTQTQESPA